MIIRTAWLYSTFGNNFVKTMIRLGKERESLGVVFDQIGTPTYARDLARAIFAAIHKGVVPGLYHFSDEGVCSWYDFTKPSTALPVSRPARSVPCIRMSIRQKLPGPITPCWTRPRLKLLTASRSPIGKRAWMHVSKN